jgi:hypothetical protein
MDCDFASPSPRGFFVPQLCGRSIDEKQKPFYEPLKLLAATVLVAVKRRKKFTKRCHQVCFSLMELAAAKGH